MATVYLAEDLKHHRRVAIKVLKSELGEAIGPDRFLREIEIAARLNHPHILALIDSGRACGLIYYVMPFVEGGSLRDRLDRERELPIDETLHIIDQVANALDYAHREGILHRDIKPQNILLQHGQALLADFGISLAIHASGDERLTETGLTLGTPLYMSPEQASAERELDARSEIYSLACVTYEMLVGEPPYTGPTAQALLTKRLSDPAPSARRLRESIPSAVDNALMRALARLPLDRFGTATEFAAAMRAQESESEAPPKSMVVLPFANLSPDQENGYFADGLTDELIAELSRLRELRVISRTSAMLFKGAKKSIPSIAKELGVRYALEGSVRRSGENVRITAQLIDATTDTHLWAERYSGNLENIFDLQESISRRIARELQITLTPEEERHLTSRRLEDPRAYDAWLLAMQHGRMFTKAGIDHAVRLTQQALSTVGDNALLYAALSFFHCQTYDFGISHDEETLLKAERFATKALELNPHLGHALFSMGLVKYKRGDLQEFVRCARRAWEMDHSSDVSGYLGFVLSEAGKIAAARPYAEDALSRDPLVFNTWFFRAAVDLFDGQFEAARGRLQEAVDKLAPDEAFAGWWLAQTLAYSGDEERSHAQFTRIAEMKAGFWSDMCEFFRLAIERDLNGVQRTLAGTNLRQMALTDEYYPLFLANGLTHVGETGQALDWLERAITWGFTNHQFLRRHNRFLEPLRGEPRFEGLMERASQRESALEL